MRRLAAIAIALAGLAALLAGRGSAAGGEESYEVRAIFDNAAFLAQGEEVRIAGAAAGKVVGVELTGVDEPVHADGRPQRAKAAVTLRIDDPGFQDFRADASCLIRPQSLIGEKYVECEPTQPRAEGSPQPRPLEVIPDGRPGAGDRLLPLEQNGKTVDLDLVNSIWREPYPERLRLILNNLGAGLAARGDDLEQIIDRSDPALRQTNEVLAILAGQNRELARLTEDADTVLTALVPERDRIKGFVNGAAKTAAATAERGRDLELGLKRLPRTLDELRSTMVELQGLSETGEPVLADLRSAAPQVTRATRALGPFADESTGALTSLGQAAAASREPLVKSDPLIRQLRGFARSAGPAFSSLSRFLVSFDERGGVKNLLKLIWRGAGTTNAFDDLGHFARAALLVTNCNDYATAPQSGCIANFLEQSDASDAVRPQTDRGRADPQQHRRNEGSGQRSDETAPSADEARGGRPGSDDASVSADPEPSVSGAAGPGSTEADTPGTEPAPSTSASPEPRMREAQMLLDYLIGRRDGAGKGRRR